MRETLVWILLVIVSYAISLAIVLGVRAFVYQADNNATHIVLDKEVQW